MPANTTKGFPYPLPTDPVADGDDAIKNLAQAVDTNLGTSASGDVDYGTVGTTVTSVAVTFPAGRFVIAPRVFMQGIVGLPTATQNSAVWPTAVTATGFAAAARRSNEAPMTACWLAVQV